MNRYWISWYSGNYADEGCTKPPFQFWTSGYRARENYGLTEEQYTEYLKIADEDEGGEFLDTYSRDTCTLCAMVDAENEDQIWEAVAKYFPDQEYRFCELQTDPAATTGDRFPDFQNRTSLYEKQETNHNGD